MCVCECVRVCVGLFYHLIVYSKTSAHHWRHIRMNAAIVWPPFFLPFYFISHPSGFLHCGADTSAKSGKNAVTYCWFCSRQNIVDQRKQSFFLNPHFFCPSLFPPLAPLSPDEWKRNDCEASATIIFFLNIGGSNAACCACHLCKQLAGYGYSPLSMPWKVN